MPGREALRIHLQDAQATEPQLPQPEVGQNASRLIKDIKQRLKRLPAYGEAQLNLILADVPINDEQRIWSSNFPFENVVEFPHGNNRVEFQHATSRVGEDLKLTRYPVNPDEKWK
jgi:hypothetical protein